MQRTNSLRSFHNEVLFEQDTPGHSAFIIQSGKVLISKKAFDETIPLRVLGAGEVIAAPNLTSHSTFEFTAQALGKVEVVQIQRADLEKEISQGSSLGMLLIEVILGAQMEREHRIDDAVETQITKDELENIELEVRISEGLASDEFLPFYQPIYDLKTGILIGCESLLRWKTKDKGLVAPAGFIDVMENSSLIQVAGQVVIEKSMRDLAKITSIFKDQQFSVNINISAKQFLEPQFFNHLEHNRTKNGLHSHQVKLEITERIMTESLQSLSALHVCRGNGYNLAIDDFGTGYSCLQYLANMPLTDLKIDRSFVMSMLQDSKSFSIVKSLVSMAKNLELNLTAEGIESQEELRLLTDLNVQQGQGYLFAKPCSLEEFMDLPRKI